jgi:hypothetical protein
MKEHRYNAVRKTGDDQSTRNSHMGLLLTQLAVGAQKTAEQAKRIIRARIYENQAAERCQLAQGIRVRTGLPHINNTTAYAPLPAGTISEVDAAVEFTQKLWRDRRFSTVRKRKEDYRATILAPRTYEEAPPIFDLAFSDDVLSIAIDYLGEVPVLHNIEVWATPTNNLMKGSQYYHRDGGRWYLRRAKFLFNMIDIGPNNGPFTFLPANVSMQVANASGRVAGRFEDDEIFKSASKSDEVCLIGPAGTGAVVDSSRCLHFGSRAREGNRLLIMFHFLPLIDLVEGGDLRRTSGFRERFGEDPVRNLVIPRDASVN